MKTPEPRRIGRREFMTRMGATAAGLAAASAIPLSPTRARAVDLKGSGTVVVSDGGGSWGAAQKVAYVEPFEALTGIKVVTSPLPPPTKLRAAIKAGAPGYDAVDFSGARVDTFRREGLLQPIDYRWFDPADRAAFAPVRPQEFAVPAFIYALVLAYDPAKFGDRPPRTWADFWDVKRFPGGRSVGHGTLTVGPATFEVALLADGVPPDKLYPLDWDRAFRSLDRIRPAITKFWQTGAESVQLIVDGQVTMATAWNGRVAEAQAKGAKIAYSWEQGILQYDAWVVPKGAKNAENAMKFIAFASQGRHQAKFAEHITYAPTNPRAYEFLRPERAQILATAPSVRPKLVTQDYGFWNRAAAAGKTNEQLAPELWEKWITRAG